MPEPLNQQIDRLQEILFSERDPNGRAFVPLADAHRRLGELDRALEVLQEGLGAHPTSASGHVVAGWLYQDRGDDASAIEAFERVLELDDENGAALRSLAGLVEATRGLSYAERLVELEPDDARSLATLEELRATVAASAEPEAGAVPFDEPAAAAQPVAAEPAPPDSSVGDASAGAIPVEDLAPDEVELDEPVLEVSARAEDAHAPAPVVAEIEPGVETAADESTDGAEIYTKTLAELYAKQGAADKAVEVYRKLLEDDPDNGMFLHRVAELTRGVDVGPVAEKEPLAESDELPAPESREAADDRPLVPVESLAPDPEPMGTVAPVVSIESLAPDAVEAEPFAEEAVADRPVVPIEALAPGDPSEGRGADPFPWMNKL